MAWQPLNFGILLPFNPFHAFEHFCDTAKMLINTRFVTFLPFLKSVGFENGIARHKKCIFQEKVGKNA